MRMIQCKTNLAADKLFIEVKKQLAERGVIFEKYNNKYTDCDAGIYVQILSIDPNKTNVMKIYYLFYDSNRQRYEHPVIGCDHALLKLNELLTEDEIQLLKREFKPILCRPIY